MSEQKTTTKMAIDVDIAYKKHNAENPDKKEKSRKTLAESNGVHVQLFSDWKGGKTPKAVITLYNIAQECGCSMEEMIVELNE